MTIYPEIYIQSDNKYCQISTFVRIKGDDGKYYLKKVEKSYFAGQHEELNAHKTILNLMEEFQVVVHVAITITKPNQADAGFKLDRDQTPEEERLINKYYLK
jgi:hypothetical protein